MKKKVIDPEGFRTCNKCKVLYPLSFDNFSKNSANKLGLNIICKLCDNLRRSIAEKSKKYHNHPKICKMCKCFFYASLADINKGKREKKSFAIYCSKKCVPWRRNGISWNGKRKGSNNPNFKLKEDEVKNIKKMINEGQSMNYIIKKYGVSRSCIYSIKSGKNWSHVAL